MTNIARDGAPKRPQTSFEPRTGMKDMTEMSGIAPANPGTGPDAGDPNPLAREPLVKEIEDVTETSWGMTDADGDGLDTDLGDEVIDEAVQAVLPGA